MVRDVYVMVGIMHVWHVVDGLKLQRASDAGPVKRICMCWASHVMYVYCNQAGK